MGINFASFLRACGARGLAVALAGLLLPGVTWAFAPDPQSVYASGRTTISPTVTNPNWTAGGSAASGFKFSRNFEMAAPAGKKVYTNAYVTVPAAGVNGARRFLAKALKALPLVGTGIAAWELWEWYRCKPGGTDGECDMGEPPTMQTVPCWRSPYHGTQCFATPYAAAEAAQKYQTGCGTNPNVVCGPVVQNAPAITNATQSYYWAWCSYQPPSQTSCTPPGGGNGIVLNNSPTQQQACENAQPPGPDGKCATGDYEPATLDYMENLQANYPPATAEHLAALNSALDYIPYDIDGNPFHPRTEGTPNVEGNTTTTTGPNGTTTTTETYAPDEDTAGVVDWTKTTTKTNPDNTTETTTETKPEESDPCKGLEGTLGCMQAGDAPTVAELTNTETPVAITPMGGWGSDNASCPAFESATFLGQTITFDHSIICNFASGMRPVIIGVAWLLAALIVLGIRTSGDG
jgi:hypothetical protein